MDDIKKIIGSVAIDVCEIISHLNDGKSCRITRFEEDTFFYEYLEHKISPKEGLCHKWKSGKIKRREVEEGMGIIAEDHGITDEIMQKALEYYTKLPPITQMILKYDAYKKLVQPKGE